MSERDDPALPTDATVVRQRPRPGAGKRPGARPEPARPSRPPAPAPRATTRRRPVESTGIGLNPLAQAASPLLLLAGRLRTSASAPAEVRALRAQTLLDVRRFESQLGEDGVPPPAVQAASYALCATLDEAVLSTPWGEPSGWGQQTLLVELHNQTFGGQKFFELLDELSRDPVANLDFIELQYLCLAVGFSGKYFTDSDHARAQLADVHRRTYGHILDERGAPQSALSDHWRGKDDRRNPIVRYVPWWVVALAGLAVVVVTWAVLSAWLTTQAQPVKAALASVGSPVRPSTPAPPPQAGPTIRKLLADAERRQAVRIEEFGGETWVTPIGELFASGSARLNPSYDATLAEIARALEQVPGRVLVTGHTDAQAIRRGEFRDNYDLSRARAATVVSLFQSRVSKPLAILVNGAGPDKPYRQPATDPANYAANRRVEIVHTIQTQRGGR